MAIWPPAPRPARAPTPHLLGALRLLPPPPEPPGLRRLSCLLVQFHFLTGQMRGWLCFPFTPTGWLSAALASALVRKIKKEVKAATALELPAGERMWAWLLQGRSSQCPLRDA